MYAVSAAIRLACLSAALGAAACAQAAPIAFDSFSDPAPADVFFIYGPTPQNPNPMMINQSSASIWGGQRQLGVQVIGTPQFNSAVGLIGHDSVYNIDSLQIGTNGRAGAIVTLTYAIHAEPPAQASLVSPPPALGADLTDGGHNDAFMLHFQGLDAASSAGMSVEFIVSGPDGTSSVTTKAFSSHTAFEVNVPFASLIGTAQVTNVDTVSVVFNGDHTPNVDFEVQFIGAVPEPGSAVLMVGGLGLLAAGGLYRRKRPTAQPPRADNSRR